MFSKVDEKLEREIMEIPAIDIHSHISPASPKAAHLSDILLYHYIATELITAGMPPSLLKENLSDEEKVKNSIPYFKRIENTATYWSLRRILEDLYGFKEELTLNNWERLDKEVQRRAEDSGWTEFVLKRKAKIEKTFLTCIPEESNELTSKGMFVPALRIDNWINPFYLRENTLTLEKITDKSISSLEDLASGIKKMILGSKQKSVCLTAAFGPGVWAESPDGRIAQSLFQKLMGKEPITELLEGLNILSSYILHVFLDIARKSDLTFQMMFGVRRPLPVNKELSYFDSRMFESFYQLFDSYSEVKFDIFLASVVHSQEVNVICKKYPNVYLAGYWWYAFYPIYIRRMLKERLEIVPANKISGFFSDAYVAEWSYGKLCLIRKELTRVLSEKVKEGYYSESYTLEIAKLLLNQNPRDIYNLNKEKI